MQERPCRAQPEVLIIDKKVFLLLEPFCYEWILREEQDPRRMVYNRIRVSKGFRWDGASVPRLFWKLGFTPAGKYNAAALIHDILYLYKGTLPGNMFEARIDDGPWHSQSGAFLRKDADRLFGKMMREAGVKPFKRWTMFKLVHWFGWLYWRDGSDAVVVGLAKLLMSLAVLTLLLLLLL